MTTCYYDDSLKLAVRAVQALLPDDSNRCTYLRDGQGRLHVYVPVLTSPEITERLERELRRVLGGYVPSFGPVIKGEPSSTEPSLFVLGDQRVRYIERRFSGVDWVQEPSAIAVPPRLVFYSIKGGVGRTTALIVLAHALALKRFKVLVIDLDLEAPGLGVALLAPDNLPEFGALDWLVEAAIQGESVISPREVTRTSVIAKDQGQIDVVPAFGLRCQQNSSDVLSKLSRVVVEGSGLNGPSSFGSRVSDLIDHLTTATDYDCVLVDARAGLSELSAAPLLGLGADLLLFMSDSYQSFATYTALLAHLQRFAPTRSDLEGQGDWRLRIKAVRGRVGDPTDSMAAARFNDKCYDVFSSTIYDQEASSLDSESFTFDPDDLEAPHSPIEISFDFRFQTFEPLIFDEQARQDIYRPAFGAFVDWCVQRLGLG